jgi:hypothetical protein
MKDMSFVDYQFDYIIYFIFCISILNVNMGLSILLYYISTIFTNIVTNIINQTNFISPLIMRNNNANTILKYNE